MCENVYKIFNIYKQPAHKYLWLWTFEIDFHQDARVVFFFFWCINWDIWHFTTVLLLHEGMFTTDKLIVDFFKIYFFLSECELFMLFAMPCTLAVDLCAFPSFCLRHMILTKLMLHSSIRFLSEDLSAVWFLWWSCNYAEFSVTREPSHLTFTPFFVRMQCVLSGWWVMIVMCNETQQLHARFPLRLTHFSVQGEFLRNVVLSMLTAALK